MIVYMDTTQLERLANALEITQKQARPKLKKAINDTAKDARASLIDRAREVYLYKKGLAKKDIKIKNATVTNLTAILHASGCPLELYHFSAKGPVAWDQTVPGAPATKGHAKKRTPMKFLQHDGLKAFIARMPSTGHRTIVRRSLDWASKDTGLEERYLETVLTVSLPQMLGNEEEVYNYVLPTISSSLERHVMDQILYQGVKAK